MLSCQISDLGWKNKFWNVAFLKNISTPKKCWLWQNPKKWKFKLHISLIRCMTRTMISKASIMIQPFRWLITIGYAKDDIKRWKEPVWICFAGSSNHPLVTRGHVHPEQVWGAGQDVDDHQGQDDDYHQGQDDDDHQGQDDDYHDDDDDDVGAKLPAVVGRTLEENKFPFLHLLLLLLWKTLN